MKRWQFWLGIVISAVFLYFALRDLNLGDFWSAIKSANYWWIFPGIAVYFVGVWARAWRWHYLLKPIKKITTNSMFPITCIGYMGNNIYPARAGEVLRSILLKQSDDVPISGSLATIVVERLFDGITILALVLLNFRQLMQIAPDAEWMRRIQTGSVLVGAIFALVLLVFLAMLFLPKQTQAVSGWFINKLLPQKLRPKVSGILDKFIDGLRVLRSPGQSLLVLALSMLVWIFEAGLYWGVMKALGLELSFMSLLLIEGVVNLVLLIPAAPGGLGTFDAAAKFMLSLFGIPPEQALGYALILRVALWIPITALGALFFIKEGFSLTTNLQQIQTDYRSDEGTEN